MCNEPCYECMRLIDMVVVRKRQLDAAQRLLDDHLMGRGEDDSLIVVRPDAGKEPRNA
jgi:hypothetical protein